MTANTQKKLRSALARAADQYYRLILIVGAPRSGKTRVLLDLAQASEQEILNVNLVVSELLLNVPARKRPASVSRAVDALGIGPADQPLLLDNTEILFSPDLQIDPLRLLQQLGRNRTVVATWAGDYDGGHLTYAQPNHTEYRRYDSPEAILVRVSN